MKTKSSKDLAFDRERDRYRKRINELEEKLDLKNRIIFDLESENKKLKELNGKYISLIGKSNEEITELMKHEKEAADMAKLFNSALIGFL